MLSHEAVTIVGAVQGLAKSPQVLGGVLALLGQLHDLRVVGLRELHAFGVEKVLADEESTGSWRNGAPQVLPADHELSAWGSIPPRAPAISLPSASRRGARPCSAAAPELHLRKVGRVAGLDGGDELLLPVTEGGPVQLDLDLPLGAPGLDLLGQDVVAGGDEALEEPDAELRPALGLAIERSTCRPAAVPPVTTAARRRNSRRAMRPASSASAALRSRGSVMLASLAQGPAGRWVDLPRV